MKIKHIYTPLILLIFTFSGLCSITTTAEAQDVHALLIILGNDREIRESVEKNEEKMLNMLQQLSRHCNVKLTLMKSKTAYQGEVSRITYANTRSTVHERSAQDIIRSHQVENWLANLRPKSEDTVLIYYCGHGEIGSFDTHALLFDLDGSGDTIDRQRLSQKLNQKPARLRMLITDTCSVFSESFNQSLLGSDLLNSLTVVGKSDQQSYTNDLFLKHKGFLDITAASPRQYAIAHSNIGGHFTAALLSQGFTATGKDNFVSWTEAFEKTKEQTKTLYTQASFDAEMRTALRRNRQETQEPVAHSLPTPMTGDTDSVDDDFTETQTTATLDVTSTPSGATVFIDGTPAGTTPLRKHEIDIGARAEKEVTLILMLEGYNLRTQKKTLLRGENTSWNVRFGESGTSQQSEPSNQGRDTVKMMRIPAGEFQMGSQGDDLEAEPDEKPIHTVYIDEFYIDIHPVTVGQYKQFIRATGHRALPDWVPDYSPTDQHPVVGVSWHDAMAYATWTNKRLPTEAEWEKAARSGLTSQKYPWGNAIDASKANYGENVGATTTPVDRYMPNAYGLHDMAGNVWEWCLDEYDATFYARSPRRNPFSRGSITETVKNFKSVKTERVLRGGAWANTAQFVRAAARDRLNPSEVSDLNGFRCVRSENR